MNDDDALKPYPDNNRIGIHERFLSNEESAAVESGGVRMPSMPTKEELDAAAEFGTVMRGRAEHSGTPHIDYAVLQRFAAQQRLPYNALCTAVREAVATTKIAGVRVNIHNPLRIPGLEERVAAIEQRVMDIQRWQARVVARLPVEDLFVQRNQPR